jgi:MFS family permease
MTREQRRVVLAASLGTVFEWYDFFLYGSLVAFLSTLFFPPQNETAALLSALATFGAGFAVRPLGALVFGRIGDRIGRKHTFLITISVMGLSTALIGVLPAFDSIGWWAPILLVSLRLAQGLALGGEYGGAAIYVAEHAPTEKRGYHTSYINATASLGFLMSIAVVVTCRFVLGEEAFAAWGWRVPFLLSVLLLAISLYVRLQLRESPVFAELRSSGQVARAPIRESFASSANRKLMLVAIAGFAGTTVVWYTALFYTFVFLQATLGIELLTAAVIVGVAVLIGVPLHVLAGAASDRIGRRKVMLSGMLLGALVLIPAFQQLIALGNPQLAQARERVAVVVHAEPYRLFAGDAASEAAKRIRDALTARGVSYHSEPARGEGGIIVRIGGAEIVNPTTGELSAALTAAGFPERSSLPVIRGIGDITWSHLGLMSWITLMVAFSAMMYGPAAAFFVELFPTRIRYTSLSVPYHITSGWLGGFMPLSAAAIVLLTGDVLAGLWYPIVIALAGFVISCLFMPETCGRDLRAIE